MTEETGTEFVLALAQHERTIFKDRKLFHLAILEMTKDDSCPLHSVRSLIMTVFLGLLAKGTRRRTCRECGYRGQ